MFRLNTNKSGIWIVINKKIIIIGILILAIIAAVALVLTQYIIPQQQLRGVNALVDSGEYNKALVELSKMKRYDTPERIDEIRQKKAVSLLDSGNYDTARIVIENLYDINPMIPQIQATAQILLEKGDYDNAYSMYQLTDDISPITNTLKEIRERNKEYSNKISVSSQHIVGLKADGTVVATGDNDYGQCNVSGWKDIVAIAANGGNTIGIKKDGTIVTCGENNYGQCNVSDWDLW